MCGSLNGLNLALQTTAQRAARRESPRGKLPRPTARRRWRLWSFNPAGAPFSEIAHKLNTSVSRVKKWCSESSQDAARRVTTGMARSKNTNRGDVQGYEKTGGAHANICYPVPFRGGLCPCQQPRPREGRLFDPRATGTSTLLRCREWVHHSPGVRRRGDRQGCWSRSIRRNDCFPDDEPSLRRYPGGKRIDCTEISRTTSR